MVYLQQDQPRITTDFVTRAERIGHAPWFRVKRCQVKRCQGQFLHILVPSPQRVEQLNCPLHRSSQPSPTRLLHRQTFGHELVVVLAGGDKRSQPADIKLVRMATDWERES